MSRTNPPPAKRAHAPASGLVLRVGLVVQGALVVETLLPPHAPLTVGQSPENTLCHADPSLPEAVVLVETDRRGQRWLWVTPGLTATLRTADGLQSLPQLLQRPGVEEHSGVTRVPLHPSDCGKLVVGAVTLLFQQIEAPTRLPPPRPGRFRPRLLDKDDPVFLGFLSVTAAAVASMALWVAGQPPVEQVAFEQLPDYFATVMLPPPAPPAPPPVEEAPPPVAEPQGTPVERAAPAEPEPTPETTEPAAAPVDSDAAALAAARRDRAARDTVLQSGIFAAIGTLGEGADVGLETLKGHLDDIESDQTASTQGPALRRSTGPGGRGDRRVGLGTTGVRDTTAVATVEQTAPRASSKMGSLDFAPPDDPAVADSVRDTVARHSGRVQHCYEKALKKDPSLAGRLVVEFDVVGGRVSRVSLFEDTVGSAALNACVTGSVRSWRFGPEVNVELLTVPFALSSR